MADTFFQEKSEAPTARRRDDFRKKGQVAHSTELSHSVVIFAAALALWLVSDTLGGQLLELLRSELLQLGRREWTIDETLSLVGSFVRQTASVTFTIVGVLVPVAGVIALCQSTFQVNFDLISLNWSKLAPAQGASRIFSMRSCVQALSFVVKQVVIIGVVAWFILGPVANTLTTGSRSLLDTVVTGWQLSVTIMLALTSSYLAIGCVDFIWHWWKQEQDLKMTRQELKEEHRQEDIDPKVKARIRKLQREALKHRSISEVPNATVVITNPTHIAVAIRYQRGETTAPTVVAKGTGVFAKRIVRIARDHGIPVIERKPLARALYALVEVKREIPPSLYKALAEILAHIYRMRRPGR